MDPSPHLQIASLQQWRIPQSNLTESQAQSQKMLGCTVYWARSWKKEENENQDPLKELFDRADRAEG